MRRFGPLLFALALVLAAVGLRWPFLHRAIWNLDEGSTFTMAEQVLHGDVLYRDAADNRSPLIPYLKAAIFAVCGEWNAYAVHLVLALLLGGCAVALWRLARRLGDEPTGVAAALVFTVLTFVMLDTPDALSANTGWFLVVFSTFGFAAFGLALAKKSLRLGALAGALFGFSFLCKQPGLLDFGTTWVLLALLAVERRDSAARRDLFRLWLAMLAGAALPVLAFVAYFAVHGALPDAIYYAFTYNTTIYVPEVPRLERLAMMRRPFELALQHAPVVFALALAAAVALLIRVVRALRSAPLQIPLLAWLILGWSAAGIVATGLSGRGFSHYSAQVVPGFSLAAGWLLARIFALRRRPTATLRWLAFAGIAVAALALGWDYVRRTRLLDPVDDDARRIGALIAAQSAPTDRIFVWGYFPEFYYFARRLPATRFVYTVFVTGMIPWTNLDPLIDTSYASVPGSRAALQADLRRHPPTLILDTGGSRGYLKYPLREQPELWTTVRQDFAQVDVDATAAQGLRLFRRLRAFTPASLGAGLPEDPALVVTGFSPVGQQEPPRLRVHTPAGVSAIELYAGDERVAVLDTLPGRPVDALFTIFRTAPGVTFRAVAITPAGRAKSAPLDFNTFVDQAVPPRPAGPAWHVGAAALLPAVERADGPPSPSPTLPDTWRVDPPSRLEYHCPPGINAVSFVHGQEKAVQGRSDGYDLLVEFIPRDGPAQRLLLQRLHPRTVGSDQAPQRQHLALPPHHGGRLVFRFLAGERNEAQYDWVFFGQLTGETSGAAIALGDRFIFPSAGTDAAHSPRQLGTMRWATHAPTQLEWVRPDALASLDLSFGLDDGSYTAPNGHSDGVALSLDLVGDDGQTRHLFAQSLWPFNHPEHRGPQHAHIDLPPHVPGRLVYRVDPGPRGDTSWDWAWLDDPVGDGYGPAIVINSTRRIVPDSSRVLDGSPSKRDGPDRWGAHADSELVFTRPADLRHVTFTYGLAESAARDEAGRRRSDGVVVTVEFTGPGDTKPVELFRRALDPFANPADFGPQTATLTLPPWREGRLVFRIDRGPNHDASFDWAYWGPFTGVAK